MKMQNFKNLVLVGLLCFSGFGCSMIESLRKSDGGNSSVGNTAPLANKSDDSKTSSATSPCSNKYNPVADGAKRNYKMSVGGKDANYVQRYTSGAANFTEEMTMGTLKVTHKWECTPEGLVAANPGSMMQSSDTNVEPKHISGVTLPNDSELQVGKEWTTVYQSNGKTAAGNTTSDVTLRNKVVSMDDEVKVPGGDFKAVKVEINVDVAMKMGGKSMDIPTIKTYAWFAPGVGLVKSQASVGGPIGNSTMEYVGDK